MIKVTILFAYLKTKLCLLFFQGWLWVVIALTVFAADFAVRLYRRNHSSYHVSKVVHLPGDVTQFTLTTQQTLLLKPGQVVLEVNMYSSCFKEIL